MRNLVDGQWTDSVTGRTLERRNPADERDLVSVFPESDAKDAEAAVAGVQAGWHEWAAKTPEQRGAVLERAAAVLEGQRDLARRGAGPRGGQDPRRGHHGGLPDADEPALLRGRGAADHRADHPQQRRQPAVHLRAVRSAWSPRSPRGTSRSTSPPASSARRWPPATASSSSPARSPRCWATGWSRRCWRAACPPAPSPSCTAAPRCPRRSSPTTGSTRSPSPAPPRWGSPSTPRCAPPSAPSWRWAARTR